MRRYLALLLLLFHVLVFAQASGKLQLHFTDVGQANRRTGAPPAGWHLHTGCPTTE